MSEERKCSSCGAVHSNWAAFCIECGTPLPSSSISSASNDEDLPTVSLNNAQQASEVAGETRPCPTCRNKTPTWSAFCVHCGEHLQPLKSGKKGKFSWGQPLLWTVVTGVVAALVVAVAGVIWLLNFPGATGPADDSGHITVVIPTEEPVEVAVAATPSPTSGSLPSPASSPTSSPSPTPSPSPSATPTAAVTSTPTAIPLGRKLISVPNIDADEWIIGPKNEDGLISYSANGAYHFVWPEADGADLDFYTYDHYQDFAAEVTGWHVEGDSEYTYGLIFRIEDDENYYTAEINQNHYLVGRMLDNDWDLLVEPAESDALQEDGPNTLRIVVKGRRFTLYGNDTFLTSTSDNNLESGMIGIYATGERGNHVALSNFNIWSLPGRQAVVATPTPRPTPKPASQQAYISLNKGENSIYAFGEQIQFCFRLNYTARATATVYAPDGQTFPLGSWPALGSQQECIGGPISTPRGWNRVELVAYNSNGSVSATQSVSFRVD